jgi:hypothetical protein
MPSYVSWVDQANEKIKITDVLTNIGVFVPETILNGGNKKIYCPFGFYHSDGGTTKAMRVYVASNTAYCFSCSKRYSPVGLASAAWDTSWVNAALRLLEDSGYKPKTIEERWQEATTEIVTIPNLLDLAEALKMYCSSQDSNWTVSQLEDYIAEPLNKCLGLLNSVKSDEDAIKWLTACKQIMKSKLDTRVGELN